MHKPCSIIGCTHMISRICMDCSKPICEKHSRAPLFAKQSQLYTLTRFTCCSCINKQVKTLIKIACGVLGTYVAYLGFNDFIKSDRSMKILKILSYLLFTYIFLHLPRLGAGLKRWLRNR